MQKICYRNKGGIGNQLFMYFAAKSISLKLNRSLFIDNITGFQNDFYMRIPSINLVVNDHIFKTNLFINFLIRVNKWIPKLILNFFGIFTITETNSRELIKLEVEKMIKYPLVLMEGYFQSYSYFEEYRDEILKSVFIDFKVNQNYQAFLNDIASGKSVAIHVRRVQYDNLLSLDYYLIAVDYIKKKVDNPHFFVFSDDIEWCKENFKFSNLTFIDIKKSDEIQELYLMSQCEFHIIANSSFSWWGAYLSVCKMKIVLAPKNCSIGVINHYYPEDWILI